MALDVRLLLLYSPLEDYTRLKDLMLELPNHYQVDVRIKSPSLIATLRNIEFDLLILFTSPQEKNDLHWVKNFSNESMGQPIVVITPQEDLDFASQMIQWGVQDYHGLDEIETVDLVKSFQFSVDRSKMLIGLGKHIQERFQQLIEKNLDAMVILDSKGLIQYLNQAAVTLFDTEDTSLEGRIFKYNVEGQDVSEIEIPRRDGRTSHGELRFLPIEWNGKDCRLAMIRDLTNFSAVERLKNELSEYERLSKLKDQFIGTVSHELRTPLTIIRGAVGNMLEGIVGELNEQQKRVVKIADNNVVRLTRIIDNLLDLSRLESEKVHINPGKIIVDRFMNNIVQSFQILADEKDINLTLLVPDRPKALFADPDMIAQVMNNLISNALRYAKKQIHVRVTEVQETTENEIEDWVQVSIEDDGPGLPEDQFDNLFSKFTQHNRPQGGAGYKGTGLGLAISKAIIDQHQGLIWIESQVGQGSQFKFKLTHYNEQKVFKTSLLESIKEAELMKQDLCIIIGFINNNGKVHKKCYHPEIERMYQDIERQLRHKVLRQSDKVTYFIERGFFLIQAMTDRKGGILIKESIPELTDKIFCEGVQGTVKPNIATGISIYPEDGKTPESLLDQAYNTSQIKRVMLVDEQQSLLDIMSLLIRTKDYLVEMAIDGDTGLELARSFTPDVILLDVNMPDQDGWDLCRELRKMPNTKDVPLIILSAYDKPDLQTRLKEVKAQYLAKPYTQDELLIILKEESMRQKKRFEF